MVPLRNNVLLPFIGEAFDEAGEPKNPITNLALSILLDDLSWWGEALKSARTSGVLPPGNVSTDGSADRGGRGRGRGPSDALQRDRMSRFAKVNLLEVEDSAAGGSRE